MKKIIAIILLIIVYRQIATLLGLNKSLITIPTQIATFICVYLFLVKLYHTPIYYRNYRRLPIRFENIEFEPLTIAIEHHVIRIPLEDRVDLDIEDHHNVHNKTIKRTAIMAISELKKSDSSHYSIESAIDEIDEYLNSKPKDISENIIVNAKEALRLIDDMDSLYYTANIQEREVIRLIWERINHQINNDKINQLKENFAKELADCYRGNGSVHCCEGRITRLLQSLQNCDTENIVDLRPMWAFKEEIENKITKYREKLFKKAPVKYSLVDKKLELTDDDHKLIDQFNRCLLKNLNDRFKKDYIEPGYLNKEELDDITKVYYESLYDK